MVAVVTPNTKARLWAGFDLTKGPLLMGIVNVTPDSFSDGGQFKGSSQAAVEHGLRLSEEGAHILDVGGESTRPGAIPVDRKEELRRILPVIEALAAQGKVVSVDTRHADVMREAVSAGASIINDVCALQQPKALEAAAELRKPCILMHMQGIPQTMQHRPQYRDVVDEVAQFLLDRVKACKDAGIEADKLCIDPGMGFGKTVQDNLDLINASDCFVKSGYAVMIGASRKSSIAVLDRAVPAHERVAGTLALHLRAFERGVQIFRVHDVAQSRQFFNLLAALEARK